MPDPKKPGILRNLRVKRVSLVEMGANFDTKTQDGAHIMLYKSATEKADSLSAVHVDTPECKCFDCGCIDDYEKSAEHVGKDVLDAKARHALPDSAFAAVWTDSDGKKHRKLPIHDSGHLAAARGRIDAAQIPEHVKAEAKRKIEAATNKEKPVAKTFKSAFQTLVKAFTETDETKRAALVKEASEIAAAAPEGTHEGEDKLSPEHITAMKAAHEAMGKAIHAFGAGPHPDGHPVHAMKAHHDAMGKMLKAAGCEVESDEPGGLAHPAVAKAVSELEKSNKDLRAALEVEKGIRLDAEMRDILKSFKATPFKLEGEDNDVAKFRKMREQMPEAYESTMRVLRAADAQAAMSKAFSLNGSSRGGDGSAEAQLIAKANSVMEKSKEKMTPEQAFDFVCCQPENAELLKRYRMEQN